MKRLAFLVVLVLFFGWFSHAEAKDLKIRSPIIDSHELEFEHNLVFGRGGSKTFVHELEYGVTSWFKPGIEVETAADPGGGLHFDAAALEGFFQLTPQGEYAVDLGWFAEWEHPIAAGDPQSILTGPLIQREQRLFGFDTVHTANVLFEKDVGKWSSGPPSLFVAWQSRVRLDPHFEPGFEYYGQVSFGGHGDEPEHRIGPAFAGRVSFRELNLNLPGGIRYDAAYLRGLTRDTDSSTFRVRVEFEFPL